MNRNFHDPVYSAACKERFGLTYHVEYAFECARTIGFDGKDVLEAGGSLAPEFVAGVLGAQSWTAIETPDYGRSLSAAGGITHRGTVLGDRSITPRSGFGDPLTDPYSFCLAAIEDLPASHEGRYDLVFSIATFEHIANLPLALDAMYRALKPGGMLFSIFAPVWSSFNGHHLPDMTDAAGNRFTMNSSPIPPWGHLLLRPPAMYELLCSKTDRATAALMNYYIYQAPSINRLHVEDYVAYITQTPFVPLKLEAVFEGAITAHMQSALQQACPGRSCFAHNGIYLILKKC